MKNFKKNIALLLSATLILTFASCAKSAKDGDFEYAVDEVDGTTEAELAFGYDADVAVSDSMLPEFSDSDPDSDLRAIDNVIINGENTTPQAGKLTAGAWSDNDNFAFWQEVLSRDTFVEHENTWGMYASRRITFTLVDQAGSPVSNQKVELMAGDDDIWEAVTDNTGTAYLFVDPFHATTQITPTAVKVGSQLFPIEGDAVNGTAMGVLSRTTELDVCFVVDTTGSMGDELDYLQEEIRDVIGRVAQENANADIRVGLVFYRDDDDEYVTKVFDFSADMSRVTKNLSGQSADGGGDFPEAVHTALDKAEALSWRPTATKLAFLVADAPAHSEVKKTVEAMRELYEDYAEEGIRLIPIASSGVDESTELLFRSGAVLTGGEYLFLTNHSGVGESHLEPTIGDYEVKALNDLLVETINRFFEMK